METINRQFGLMVAYLLPGFIGLAGVALLVPSVEQWLRPPMSSGGVGIGPPVYAVLGAMAIGMVLSCFRWLLIDHFFHWLGVMPPKWDADRMESRLAAFNYLVEAHFRYHEFFANTVLAVLWTYTLNRWIGTSPLLRMRTDLAVASLCLVLLAGSRDALAKYYNRTAQLIGAVAEKGATGDVMTNGCHKEEGGGPARSKRPEVKPQPQREVPKSDPEKDKTGPQKK